MKIAFIYSSTKLSGQLTKLFTNSYCYHVGWVDEQTDTFYDMHLIRRKRRWSSYASGKEVVLINSPVQVTREWLEERLMSDDQTYGYFDYLLFGLRGLYHMLGLSTPNARGVICSEMVYLDLRANGWPHRFEEVPSPADLERVLL